MSPKHSFRNIASKRKNPCFDCGALCCRNVAVSLDTPRSKKSWDEIRWLVAHKNVHVFKDLENDWLVEFLTDCDKLDVRGRCKIYKKRPITCREHEPHECIINGAEDYYKIIFRNAEDVEKFLEKKKVKQKKKQRKSNKQKKRKKLLNKKIQNKKKEKTRIRKQIPHF